ncbi:6-phosphogluconolactonase [bacterium HR10]|uniref:6-phosphogluconolactonase n=1 Tax=uncultured Acidobacteriota bacterium TaxID=171953 RepID=H5SG47_9BACT|nr:6-phosphogluconolactonase [uncultured Acidobacteriota bacterium]GBC81565.1 6-phosphogluconolactonase [bacterium HR10]
MERELRRGELLICRDAEELALRAAMCFVELAEEFIARNGRFCVALSGGSTPRGLYARLASPPFRERVIWSKVHLFWGDERCVPPDHPESNYGMVERELLTKVPIPPANVHRMPGEKDPEEAAVEYAHTLRTFFGLAACELPAFDLVLLGLGEDGHTASLFPGTDVLHERTEMVRAVSVEKLGVSRLTLTAAVFNHAANVIFLVSGERKAAVLREVLLGEEQPDRLPAQLIAPTRGQLLWIVDRDAAREIVR